MIRAALSLAPDRPVGKAEARQAVLMAFLGTCPMNPLARFLHAHMPDKVVRDLKSLVENNCITVKKGNTLIDVPLRTDLRIGSAEMLLSVSEEGCLPDGSPLHAVAGLRAALNALGVPEEKMPDAVAGALKRLRQSGQGDALSCERIIEAVAAQRADPARAGGRIAAALDAYAGVEHARLLSVWEATLTSAAHNSIACRHRDRLRHAVLYGSGDEHEPDSWALAAKAAQVQARLASIDRRFHADAVHRLRQAFIGELDSVIDERLELAFELGEPACLMLLPPLDAPEHDETPARVVAGPDDFKAMLRELLQQAAGRAIEAMPADDASRHSQEALKALVQTLGDYVGKPGYNDFLSNLAARFAPDGHAAADDEMRERPWKLGPGSQMVELAAIYFDRPITMVSSAGRYPPDPRKPQDARHLLHFVLDTLSGMRDVIRTEVERSPSTFHVPMTVGDRMISLTPGTFIEAWRDRQAPEQWIEKHLKTAARAHVLAPRSGPALGELLADVVTLVHRHEAGYGFPQMVKEELVQAVPLDAEGRYTLQAVFDTLAGPGIYLPADDPEAFLDCLASAILQVEPPHTIQIADTHLDSPTGNGGTDRLGVLYNPLRDTVCIHQMDDTGDGRAPLKREWLASAWRIMTTPLHDAGDRAA